MLTLSDLVELFVLCFISPWTCVVVSVSGCLQFVCFPNYVSICGVCLVVLVKSFLSAFAICVGEVIVFYLKVIVLFLGCVGLLLANSCMVFQSVCVLCL